MARRWKWITCVCTKRRSESSNTVNHTLTLLIALPLVPLATLLATGKSVEVKQTDAGVTLSLPTKAPDTIASVVCLELEQK